MLAHRATLSQRRVVLCALSPAHAQIDQAKSALCIARLGLGNGSFYALLSLGLAVIFGLAQIAEDIVRDQFGVSGQQYPVPELLQGATNLGFMVLPNYRGFVIGASLLVCLSTWYIIERTRLGACLRAGTENPKLVQAFGINVPVILGAAAYATGWLIRSAGWSTEMGVLAGMGIGALALPAQLAPGQWRWLTLEEVAALYGGGAGTDRLSRPNLASGSPPSRTGVRNKFGRLD